MAGANSGPLEKGSAYVGGGNNKRLTATDGLGDDGKGKGPLKEGNEAAHIHTVGNTSS